MPARAAILLSCLAMLLLLLSPGCAIYEPAETDPLFIGTNAGIPPTAVYYGGYTAGYVAGTPLWSVTWPFGFVGEKPFPGYMAVPSIVLGWTIGYALCAPVAAVWFLVGLLF